ncbi:hypothetical protein QVD17_39681 [Tagetes erecta]|uniref:Protein kinase domain-containing protein n=1 Tax=Tagetes erecta TaxID=13708 RepID=A0AAD8JNZ6_TARER|nr:hypothetical protein QVD17_39681 [Tagetes erecta]
MDPEYARTGKVAYDSNYIKIDRKGLASVARKYFRQKRLKDLLDAKIMHETFELGFTRKVEPDKDSLEVFSKIAIQCVAKTQVERPTIEDVIKELQKALNFQVCIDIAKGLKFLHEGDSTQDVVIHRDLKSSNILLTEDWKAKICGFEHAVTHPPNQEIVYVMDQFEGSPGYSDPLYWGTRAKTKDLDIYSFGVILFEILCGSSVVLEEITDKHWFLDRLVKKQQLPEMVFEGIKEQIAPMSLDTFSAIAFECLPLNGKQPTASDMVAQLHKALKFQDEFETKAAKLNSNDKETLSKSPVIYYSEMAKNDIYNILSKGDLLEADDILPSPSIEQSTCLIAIESEVVCYNPNSRTNPKRLI